MVGSELKAQRVRTKNSLNTHHRVGLIGKGKLQVWTDTTKRPAPVSGVMNTRPTLVRRLVTPEKARVLERRLRAKRLVTTKPQPKPASERPQLIKRLLLSNSSVLDPTAKIRKVEIKTSKERRQEAIPKRSQARPQRSRPEISDEDIFGALQDIQGEFGSTIADKTDDEGNGSQRISSHLSPLEQLPLSPLMHPQLLKARRRYTEAKPLPSKELTEFQSLLEKNPYAQKLATPVRTCILTGARLPLALLVPFSIRERPPKNSRLWIVPDGFKDLFVAAPPTQQPSSASPDADNSDGDVVLSKEPGLPSTKPLNEGKTSRGIQKDATGLANAPSLFPTSVAPYQSTFYVSAQLACISHVASLSPRSLYRLMPFRWKNHFGDSLRTVVFRDDMSTFILSLHRRRLLRKILELLTSDGHYLVPYSPDYRKEPKQLSALIWIEPRQNSMDIESKTEMLESNMTAGAIKPKTEKPEMYAIMRGEEKALPVFDLCHLLGVENVERLLDGEHRDVFEKSKVLGVKAKQATVGLIWQLWRLSGYLADEKKTHNLNEWNGP
ncbi:hypothetical protein MMC13_007144 [Lambiella insularis]|nr:hypothetical protein [Lambiella insularis]